VTETIDKIGWNMNHNRKIDRRQERKGKMQIKKHVTGGELTVKIEGRIDTTTAPMLEGELKHSVTNEIETLVFDFEQVEYMSSAGIRVIMAADRVMSRQGEMKLLHVNEEIMEMLDMTGLADLLTIE